MLQQHLDRIGKNLTDDPAAAIGSSKELAESAFKFVLDDYNVAYSKDEDMLGLYKKTAQALKTARSGGFKYRPQMSWTFSMNKGSLESFQVQKYASVELAAATRATNRVLWNRYVLPRLGGHQMIVLAHQPEIVQEFKAELVADGVGDPTIKRTLTVLSAVLGKAVEWNRIPSNPVATVRKPSGKRSKAGLHARSRSGRAPTCCPALRAGQATRLGPRL